MSPLHPPEKFIHWIAVTKFDGERGILLAVREEGDTREALIERADAAELEARRWRSSSLLRRE
jgi:hypothetical protein